MRCVFGIALLTAAIAACDSRAGVSITQDRRVESVALPGAARALTLPNGTHSIKLAVIGDAGRGSAAQRELGHLLAIYRGAFAFDHVLMAGDNIYEGLATLADYRDKFETPYRELLHAGVRFHAVLGNHDDRAQVHYEPFGMRGRRFYTLHFRAPLPGPDATIFALDSTSLDPGQLAWIDQQLRADRSRWRIVLQHHPLYSPGNYRHLTRVHRLFLEPVFATHGVDAVIAGHEHFYARMVPQRGILHLISGGAGSVRPGAARALDFVERSFDSDCHFVLIELTHDGMHFQAVSRDGRTIDAGVLRKDAATGAAGTAGPR